MWGNTVGLTNRRLTRTGSIAAWLVTVMLVLGVASSPLIVHAQTGDASPVVVETAPVETEEATEPEPSSEVPAATETPTAFSAAAAPIFTINDSTDQVVTVREDEMVTIAIEYIYVLRTYHNGTCTPPDDGSWWKYDEPYSQTNSASAWLSWIGDGNAFSAQGEDANGNTITDCRTIVINPAGPTNTPTSTATSAPTATPTDTATATPTETPADTPTEIPTNTPTMESTATPTNTPTAIPTETPTNIPTATATNTPTASPTATSTETSTATPTNTPPATPTSPATPAATATMTGTPTEPTTPIATATITAVPSVAPALGTLIVRVETADGRDLPVDLRVCLDGDCQALNELASTGMLDLHLPSGAGAIFSEVPAGRATVSVQDRNGDVLAAQDVVIAVGDTVTVRLVLPIPPTPTPETVHTLPNTGGNASPGAGVMIPSTVILLGVVGLGLLALAWSVRREPRHR